MKQLTGKQIQHAEHPSRDYPGHLHTTFYVPETKPKFHFNWGKDVSVFGIGSCFAREIEIALQEMRCNVTSLSTLFTFEGEGFPVSALNEFNPGSIAQRINWAFSYEDLGERAVINKNDRYVDLLLLSEKSQSKEWVLERRKRIQSLYNTLPNSSLVIITLGLIEAWYDTKENLYLNRIPPFDQDDRYVLKLLDVNDCVDLLTPAIKQITDINIPVVLTVSPVALSTTFSGDDPVIANEISKSTLRVAAQHISDNNPLVDYYPSYEAFKAQGITAFLEDGIHVRFPLVEEVVNEMVRRYQAPSQ